MLENGGNSKISFSNSPTQNSSLRSRSLVCERYASTDCIVIALAGGAVVGGVVTLIGWFASLPRLTDWIGSGIAMFANTALAAALAGAGLLIALNQRPLNLRIAGGLGFIVAAIGAATLFEHLTGRNLGIDQFLVTVTWGNRAAVAPGRMGPPASTSFTLLGTALMLMALGGRARRLVPLAGTLVAAISLLPIIGYGFEADPLFATATLTGIAMQTALFILALALALLASVPDLEPIRILRQNSAAGLLVRRALPFVIALPLVSGWLFIRGRHLGWFDRGIGTAMLVLTLITAFCGLLAWCAAAVASHERVSSDNEARFRSCFELGLIGMAITSPARGILEVNDELCRILGYSRNELLRMSWLDLTHPDDVNADVALFNRVMTGQIDSYSLDKRFKHRDGRLLQCTISAKCLRRQDGAVDYFVTLVHDITERTRAEEALRLYKEIFKASSDGVAIIAPDGRYIEQNESHHTLLGYSDPELQTQTPAIHLGQSAFEAIVRGLQKDGRWRGEVPSRGKDGTQLHLDLSAFAVKDQNGQVLCYVGFKRDVSERKRTEKQRDALHELTATVNRAAALPEICQAALAALRRSLDADRASILLCDKEGVMRFKAWDGLSESYRLAVEGHSPWSPGDTHPQPLSIENVQEAALDGHLREVIQREGISALAFIPLQYERRLFGKFMVYYNAPHRFSSDELLQAQAIASQIVFAIERHRSGEALEQLVTERTASLRDAIAQMEEFSYTVSHDLRAPLRGMKAYTDVLLQDFAETIPRQAAEYLERIAANANRLDKMILDVLTFTRLARAQFELERIPVDKLVRQIVEQYPGMQPPQAEIEIESLPEVMGHEPSLTQALSNLLNNAVKFVPQNVTPRVRVWSEQNNGHVRLWIADNGIGIEPKYQRRLFNMFERLHPHLAYDGTGVGLAIVRKAVERMGGRVGVESDGSHGSRFWIEVPAAFPVSHPEQTEAWAGGHLPKGA
jgi:PAS domain S-box-containing protein